MSIAPHELREITAAAATLTERFSGRFAPADAPDRDALIDARLNRWRQTATQDDAERFRARLAAEGLDEEQARRLLGAVRLNDDAPLPQWARTLEACLKDHSRESQHHQHDHARTDSDIFAPFLTFAWRKLTHRAGALLELLAEQAQEDLKNMLRARLSKTAFPTLTDRYGLGFINQMNAAAWLDISKRYPVLARLLATMHASLAYLFILRYQAERRSSEELVRRSEERLAGIVGALTDAIVMIDAQGVVV